MTTVDFHGARLVMGELGGAIQAAWEPEETALLVEVLEPGDRVLVAGGGMGWLGCLAASIVGPENVVVYEANPTLAGLLGTNIRVDGRPLRVVNLALSDQTGEGRLWVHPWWAANSLHRRPAEHGRMIPVRTMEINQAVQRDLVNVLALDIEGAEWECSRTLDWTPISSAVIEVHEAYLWAEGKDPGMVARRMELGGLTRQTVRVNAAGTHRYVAGVRD